MSEGQKPVLYAPGALYGYCPRCGAPGERRSVKSGKDCCQEGHEYKSLEATRTPVRPPRGAPPTKTRRK